MRRVAVDFGEAAVGAAGVQVGGVDVVGPEVAGGFEAHVVEALHFGVEVVDQHADVVKALLAARVHVPVDGGRLVVLLDELDHHVAQIAEGIGHVGLLGGAPIGEAVGDVVGRQHKGAGAEQF